MLRSAIVEVRSKASRSRIRRRRQELTARRSRAEPTRPKSRFHSYRASNVAFRQMENRRDSGDDVLRDACRRAKSADAVQLRGARGASSGLGGPRRSCWPRLQGGSNVMLEVDKPSVLHTLAMNLRDDARGFCARRRWRRRAASGNRRAACRCASRTPPTAPRSSQAESAGPGYTNRLGAGSPPLEVDDDGDGLVRVVVTDTGSPRKSAAPSISRSSDPPPHRRARHARA